MLKQNTIIHVALAFDQNFLTPFYVLLTSIFQNNANNKIIYHAIASGVNQPERSKITLFVQQHKGEIYFYDIDEKQAQKFSLPEYSHVSAATYYRLFLIGLVPPEIEKLLYIDTDIVVIGNLAELYAIDIQSVPVAAVVDAKITNRPELGILDTNTYFNAGVLLINLPLWNSQKISEKAIRYLNEHSQKIVFHDQDALNAVLMNNWIPISNRFNLTFHDTPEYLPKKKFQKFLKDKVIVHYTTQNKPWTVACTNRLRYLYLEYLQRSPHAHKQKYTDLKAGNKVWTRLIRVRFKEFLIDYTQLFRMFGKEPMHRNK